MHMIDNGYGFWGMHLVWWFFWVGLIVLVFGFDLPEQTRRNKNDPFTILRRRFANGELSAEEYEKMVVRLEGSHEPIRKDIVIQSSSHEFGKHPLVDGLSFSISWVILYSLCAVVYWISPDIILTATSKLFHGLSFTQMSQQGSSFGFGDYFSVVTIGAFYTFAAGALWSSVHTFLLRKKTSRREEKKPLRSSQLASSSR
jgi:putative membrane protein